MFKNVNFKEFIFWFCVIFLLCFVVGSFWQNQFLLTVILLLLAGMYFLRFHKREDFLYFFIPFFLGPIAESLIVRLGAWSYSQPYFFGVPLWLFSIWGISGLLLKKLVESLNK